MMDTENILDRCRSWRDRAVAWFKELDATHKVLVILGFLAYTALVIVTILYNQKIVRYFVNVSDIVLASGWKGKLVFIVLLSIEGFPPLIGFTTTNLIIGIIYGFSGWPMIAITSSIMSTVSLWVFKTFFTETSKKIIDRNENLQLLVSAIKDPDLSFKEELIILILIKLSPLPYSLVNGGLGCVPDISPAAFFTACVISSPKYLVQLFMGNQLRKIGGDEGQLHKTSIDYLILFGTAVVFAFTSWYMYQRLKMKVLQRSISSV